MVAGPAEKLNVRLYFMLRSSSKITRNGVACYVETGAWSKKAIAEAKKYGDVHVVASSKESWRRPGSRT